MDLTIGNIKRYCMALVLVTAAFMVRFAIEKMVGTELSPFITFYPTIMFIALVFGVGPGLAGTAAALFLMDCLIFTPHTLGHFSFGEGVSLMFFAGTCAFICLVAHRYRTIQFHMEELVAERTEKLSRVKNEWERTFDNVPDLIAIMDNHHRMVRVNHAMANCLNMTPEQCVGKVCYTVIHGTTVPPGFCPHARSMSDLAEHEAEVCEPILGGNYLVTTTPLFDQQGEVYASVHVARDITALKRTEAALREREKQLKLFIEHAPAALAMFDREMRYLCLSKRWRNDYGLDDRDLLGVSHYELFPEISETWREAHCRGLAGEVLRADADCFEHADGAVQWVRWEIRPWYDAVGDIGGIVIFAEDISERKQAEDELKKAHQELEQRVADRTDALAKTVESLLAEILERKQAEENLQRLNRLYDVLSETNQSIVRVRDRESLFQDFCRIAVENGGFLLCWTGLLDDVSGRLQVTAASGATAYLDDVRITAGEEPEGAGPTGLAIRNGTYYVCNDFQHDPRTRPWHENGRTYGICSSASIALKEESRVIGALTVYAGETDFFDQQMVELLQQMGTDISFAIDNLNREKGRREMEQALLRETTERLKAVEALRRQEHILIQQNRNAAMGEMIGNIAHQWRQPLNTLGLYTQRLAIFYGSPGFNKEFLDTSVAKSMEIIQYMSRTIDDFRNFFSTEREKSEFKADDAVHKALMLVEASFNESHIAIDREVREETVIYGFPNEYAQVLLNLFVNARDAMIERKVEHPRLKISIGAAQGSSVVTVSDNAGGIPVAIMDKIFDPYFTTKGPQQGTGIGLFMSKTIIENNMGGRLSVHNTGEGAEFRIEV
ncbi:MAG: PAS domain-containing protein [Geobacteraceae bacterium]|nr:PAS domain-containing protein [Geobacteraceae bacterium]